MKLWPACCLCRNCAEFQSEFRVWVIPKHKLWKDKGDIVLDTTAWKYPIGSEDR